MEASVEAAVAAEAAAVRARWCSADVAITNGVMNVQAWGAVVEEPRTRK